MNQYTGMDPAAVRAVAQQLHAVSQRVREIGVQIQQQIDRLPCLWEGQDALDFRGWWAQQYHPALQRAAEAVEGMARSAENNVAEQERISGVGAGGGVALSGVVGAGRGGAGGSSAQNWLDTASNGHTLVEWGWLRREVEGSEFMKSGGVKVFDGLGKVLGVFGGVVSGVQVYEGVRDGEESLAFLGGIGVAAAGLGLFAATAPLSVGVGALGGLISYSLPVGSAAQDSLLDYQAQRMFGVSADQMTPSQAERLSARYEGWWGPGQMVSDKMDQSADSVIGMVGSVGSTIGGWFR